MANSPVLWGPNSTANNLQNRELLANGALLAFNGAKNYIGYNNFENNLTTGWSLGTVGTRTNGLPTGTPTFGSGASGNLTLSATSSNPLAGTYSLSLASSAATTAGDMLATSALAIDIADQAKVLSWSFNYQASVNPTNGNWSGTSSNTFAVAVWDVTNSAWLTSAGNFNLVQSTGVGVCTGTCQTNATTASVRFVIYCANASANSITMLYDSFYLGPQTSPMAPAVGDWTAFTPVITWVANTTATGFWKRTGDTLSMIVRVALTGAPTATTLSFNLPTGMVIDATKLPANPGSSVSFGQLTGQGGAHTFVGTVIYNTSTSLQPVPIVDGFTASVMNYGVINATTPYTFANTDFIYITVSDIPIVGWSSNSVSSSDTDTRVISFSGSQATQAVTANVTDIAFTASVDRAGAWNGTQFVVPVSGDYVVCGSFVVSANGTGQVYKTGVAYLSGLWATAASANAASAGSILVEGCKAGDTLSVRCATSITITQGTIGIFRLSGPAVITATESVNARYFASATTPGTSATPLAITYTTKDYDSHNAYSSGTYTIPVSGKYQISASLLQTAATTAASQAVVIQILKNGTQTSSSEVWFTSTTSKPITSCVTDQISCNAGDTVTVKAGNDGTTPSITASNFGNYFTIARVGN